MTLDEAIKLVPANCGWLVRSNGYAQVWVQVGAEAGAWEHHGSDTAVALNVAALHARKALGLPDPVATYPAESEKLPAGEGDAVEARAMAAAEEATDMFSSRFPDVRLSKREWVSLADAIYRQIEPLMRGCDGR